MKEKVGTWLFIHKVVALINSVLIILAYYLFVYASLQFLFIDLGGLEIFNLK